MSEHEATFQYKCSLPLSRITLPLLSHADLRYVSWGVPDLTKGGRATKIPTDYHNRRPGLINASVARATFRLPSRDLTVLANNTARQFSGGRPGADANRSLADLTQRLYGYPVSLVARKFSME